MTPWPLHPGDYLMMAITIVIAAVIAAIVVTFVLAALYSAREKVELWRLRRAIDEIKKKHSIPRIIRERSL